MARIVGRFLASFLVLLFSIESFGDSQRRALLVISELDSQGIKELSQLYKKIEDLAWKVPSESSALARVYTQMHLLRDHQATLEGVHRFLIDKMSDSSIDQVDVIIGVHGLPGRLSFFDQTVLVDELVASLRARIEKEAGPLALQKLGFLYNLSCYGASHIPAFLNLGFKSIVGSRKINANAEVEYPWVLNSLAAGVSVSGAFERSNSPKWLEYADGPVRWIGRKQDNFLKDTDSFKMIGGEGDYTISSPSI